MTQEEYIRVTALKLLAEKTTKRIPDNVVIKDMLWLISLVENEHKELLGAQAEIKMLRGVITVPLSR